MLIEVAIQHYLYFPQYTLLLSTQGLMGFSQITSDWVVSFVLPYIINPDAANLGAKIAYIFFGLGVIISVLLFLYIPETKGLSYEDVLPLCDCAHASWTICSRQRLIPGNFSRSSTLIVRNIQKDLKQFRLWRNSWRKFRRLKSLAEDLTEPD